MCNEEDNKQRGHKYIIFCVSTLEDMIDQIKEAQKVTENHEVGMFKFREHEDSDTLLTTIDYTLE